MNGGPTKSFGGKESHVWRPGDFPLLQSILHLWRRFSNSTGDVLPLRSGALSANLFLTFLSRQGQKVTQVPQSEASAVDKDTRYSMANPFAAANVGILSCGHPGMDMVTSRGNHISDQRTPIFWTPNHLQHQTRLQNSRRCPEDAAAAPHPLGRSDFVRTHCAREGGCQC